MATDHSHPVDKPVLSRLAAGALISGLIMLLISLTQDQPAVATFWAVTTAVALACFLILFALYWTAWLLREHHLWREDRESRDDATAA